MKAVVFTEYGRPEGLVLRDIPRPVPGDNDLLVRIRATSVTAGDTEIRRLKLPPYLKLPMRLYAGLRRPKRLPVLGMEYAGVVEETGSAVNGYKPGDEIFGFTDFGFGAYAQYLKVPATGAFARRPAALSFQEAAVLPTGAIEALTFVRMADIRPGQKVLVYGGSGSIGSFAIQLAARAGAEVSAVGNPSSLSLMEELGAARAMDYTREDFTREDLRYDAVIDAIGKCPYAGGLAKLTKTGRLILANPRLWQLLAGLFVSLFSRKRVKAGSSKQSAADLEYLAGLVVSKELRVVIDRSYPLEEMVEAHRYVDRGEKTGNVVIVVD